MCKNLANMRLLENTKTKEQKTKEENQILHHTFVSFPSSRTLMSFGNMLVRFSDMSFKSIFPRCLLKTFHPMCSNGHKYQPVKYLLKN